MAELCPPRLRYRWGENEPEDSPRYPMPSTVALLVGEELVFEGDVTEELRAWARWCALRVVDLWECPELARRYLQTGDEELREAALAAIRGARRGPRWAWTAASSAASGPIMPALSAGKFSAASLADRAVRQLRAQNPNWPPSEETTDKRSATWDAVVDAADEIHTTYLRKRLLQRALPEDRWPLIDGDERVLCDALLEGR